MSPVQGFCRHVVRSDQKTHVEQEQRCNREVDDKGKHPKRIAQQRRHHADDQLDDRRKLTKRQDEEEEGENPAGTLGPSLRQAQQKRNPRDGKTRDKCRGIKEVQINVHDNASSV